MVKKRQTLAGSWKDNLYIRVYCGTIYNNQQVEMIQMSVKGWLDLKCDVYIQSNIFSLKKEESHVTCFNMDDT